MERNDMGRPLLFCSLLVLLLAGCASGPSPRSGSVLWQTGPGQYAFHGSAASMEIPPPSAHQPIYLGVAPGLVEIGHSHAPAITGEASPEIDCYLTVIEGTGGASTMSTGGGSKWASRPWTMRPLKRCPASMCWDSGLSSSI